MVVNLLKSLFPKGSPWNLLGDFGKIITGIGISINRVYEFAIQTIAESNTKTTIDLQNEWFNALGIKNDLALSITEKQGILNANYVGTGGQSREYIEKKIQEVFPNISIQEYLFPFTFMVGIGMVGQIQTTNYPSWIPLSAQDGSYPVYYFKVLGSVENVTQYLILQDLIKRYAPLTHIPVYINISFNIDSGVVGIGQTGISQVGRNI